MSDSKRSEIIAEQFNVLNTLYFGGTWEYEPESAEFGDEWPWSCGDHDCKSQWHKHTYVTGYMIEDGKLYHVIHECDQDGNWDTADSCDVDDSAYENWWAGYSEEERQEQWKAYGEYVAETGLDPLDEYNVDVPTEHKEEWTAKLTQDDKGILFAGAHRRSLAYIDRVAIKTVAELPREVQMFLQLDNSDYVDGIFSLSELEDCDRYRLERGDGFAIITFSVTIPNDPKEVEPLLRAALREAARNHVEKD